MGEDNKVNIPAPYAKCEEHQDAGRGEILQGSPLYDHNGTCWGEVWGRKWPIVIVVGAEGKDNKIMTRRRPGP